MSARVIAFRSAGVGAVMTIVIAIGCSSLTGTRWDTNVETVYSGTMAETTATTGPGPSGGTTTLTCVVGYAVSGGLQIGYTQHADGTVSGSVSIVDGKKTAFGQSGAGCPSQLPLGVTTETWSGDLSGTASKLSFRSDHTSAFGTGSLTSSAAFTGSESSGVVAGSLIFITSGQGTQNAQGISVTGSGTLPVTLSHPVP